MPHFKLKELTNIEKLKEEMNKIQKAENSIFVYKRILKELNKEVYKIETLAIDIMDGNKKFEQKIIIVIRKRENDWMTFVGGEDRRKAFERAMIYEYEERWQKENPSLQEGMIEIAKQAIW